jgi:hypothetical protein
MIINRQRLMVAAVLVLIPAVAFPWASVAPYEETHQYIVKTALGRLQADPAFSANSFPNFQQVEDYEGAVQSEDGRLTGLGADASGNSKYSEHYYNPAIPGQDKGQAPTAVARNFSTLAQDNLSGSKSAAGNGSKTAAYSAAYSAHFLADIFCPYHVNGVPRAIADQIWNDQVVNALSDRKRTVDLSTSIKGLDILAYLSPLKGLSNNFYTELSRFETLTTPAEFDWFDPWYYNGDTTYSGSYYVTSSHILFEARPTGEPSAEAFHQAAGQGADGYDPNWHNAAPTYDSPWVSQSKQAEQFTIDKATETRRWQENYFDNPTIALRNTIRAVFTLWRASITGLRPTLEFQPEGGDSTAYKVTGKVTNAASGAASGLRARLTTTNCTVVGDKEKSMGPTLAAGKTQTLSVSWQVQPTVDKACQLKLEVIATYAIPDLQYSMVERAFAPQHVAQEVSKPKPPEPSQPPESQYTGARFFLPTCPDTDNAKCKATERKSPAIPPGATVHGWWSCRQMHAGDTELWCICIPNSMKFQAADCGPSFNPPGCKYDGLECGY